MVCIEDICKTTTATDKLRTGQKIKEEEEVKKRIIKKHGKCSLDEIYIKSKEITKN